MRYLSKMRTLKPGWTLQNNIGDWMHEWANLTVMIVVVVLLVLEVYTFIRVDQSVRAIFEWEKENQIFFSQNKNGFNPKSKTQKISTFENTQWSSPTARKTSHSSSCWDLSFLHFRRLKVKINFSAAGPMSFVLLSKTAEMNKTYSPSSFWNLNRTTSTVSMSQM